MLYFATRFARTAGGTAFSLENGPPGATRIIKNPSVIMINIVGIMLMNLLNTNRPTGSP
jgi:hypothetical protein